MKRIKNRIHGRVIMAVTIVAAFLFGATPITAFAGGYECCCDHKCTEGMVNCDCDLCNYDYRCCQAPEGTEGPIEPTPEPEPTFIPTETPTPSPEPTEAPREEEKWGPLTPDGNMTLVDDYGAPEKSGKQFITVTSKSGNYFYIIIDRDDNGTETVHFLNQVDEADLLALMDEDAVKDYIATKDAGKTEPTVTEAPKEKEEPTPTEEPKEEPKQEKKSSAGTLIIVVILIAAGAGGYVYFTKIKGKKPQKETVDPDADYDENEDEYTEELASEVEEIMAEDEAEEDTDDNKEGE